MEPPEKSSKKVDFGSRTHYSHSFRRSTKVEVEWPVRL